MCIAIYVPANENLSDEILKNCYENNDDGCGFAYINVDNLGVKKIIIKKTMDFDVFLRQYKRAKSIAPESPFLVHFRIRTHGETTTFNAHPFAIDDEHVFIHNGIIKGVSWDKKKSDTQMFNEEILQQLPEGWMNNEGILKILSSFIDYSKLVIMDISGEVTIVNASKGTWKDKIWYSNKSYEARNYGSWGTGTTYNSSTGRTGFGTTNRGTTTTGNFGKNALTVGSRAFYTEKSVVKCDGCTKTYRSLDTMSIYYQVGTCTCFCQNCENSLRIKEGDSFGDKVDPACYIAWKNEYKSDEFNNASEVFQTWINPWSLIGNQSAIGIDKTFEEEENEYYAQLYSKDAF